MKICFCTEDVLEECRRDVNKLAIKFNEEANALKHLVEKIETKHKVLKLSGNEVYLNMLEEMIKDIDKLNQDIRNRVLLLK